jgi:hypothetical protein
MQELAPRQPGLGCPDWTASRDSLRIRMTVSGATQWQLTTYVHLTTAARVEISTAETMMKLADQAATAASSINVCQYLCYDNMYFNKT